MKQGKRWKVVVTALAIAAITACVWAPVRAHAAELSGPATLSTAAQCPASAAAGPALPGPLAAALNLAGGTDPTPVCGPCSQPVCVGKALNSFCFGFIRLCQKVSTCAAATVPLCECLSPP